MRFSKAALPAAAGALAVRAAARRSPLSALGRKAERDRNQIP